MAGLASCLLFSCSNNWTPTETILLNKVSPIGIAQLGDEIWLSDGNNNRLVQIDKTGAIMGEPIAVERPMHISTDGTSIYIPSYGLDKILLSRDGAISDTLAISMELDAPAAVDAQGDYIAVADFYNHRVLLYDGTSWKSIGGKGKEKDQMHYPTDVQLFGDKLYVADAYNNRGQIFDLTGAHLLTFGSDLGFNAATGIHVNEENIVLTDFENDRVGFFDLDGNHQYWVQDGLANPSDVTEIDNQLWILNFTGKYITVLER